jgi:hypothetical protein
MRKSTIWHLAVLAALAALTATGAAAQSLEITDIFSSIQSADVSLSGDGGGASLQVDLIHDGERMATRSLAVKGPGTLVVRWPALEAEKGSYEACATLMHSHTPISKRCFEFYYGEEEPLRFDVRDFLADSRGMHLAISATDPTVVDIYYMLIEGDRAVYVAREQAVPIAGSYATPIIKDYPWKQILRNKERYEGRVKIVELNHNQTRAFMSSFVAADDASITETYQDETGASATVLGNSRVPFDGYLRFILSQNGSVINATEKKTPVLLAGEDDTVEITWNRTLDPGVYQLRTVLLGSDGSVKDMEENVIEALPMPGSNSTNAAKEASLPGGLAALAMIAVFLILRRR